MAPSGSNGKRRRREITPSPSSDDSILVENLASDAELNQQMPPLTQRAAVHRPKKKKHRQHSPERVLESALAKIKASGSPSKGSGLNQFAALMADHKDINAAMEESTRGMKGKGKVVATVAKPKNTRPIATVSFTVLL